MTRDLSSVPSTLGYFSTSLMSGQRDVSILIASLQVGANKNSIVLKPLTAILTVICP